VLVANYAQTDREGQASVAAFLDTFQRLGWTDGRNVRIEYRWGAGDPERAKAAAAELVRSAPDAIVVAAAPALARRLAQEARAPDQGSPVVPRAPRPQHQKRSFRQPSFSHPLNT
jgi:putative tryptophan/tyrosine transport system substrate-binding protein